MPLNTKHITVDVSDSDSVNNDRNNIATEYIPTNDAVPYNCMARFRPWEMGGGGGVPFPGRQVYLGGGERVKFIRLSFYT